jgi:hypothetical protein
MKVIEEWKYVITPAFIARLSPGRLEIRRLDTDEWEACYDLSIHELVARDGTMVSQKKAMAVHKMYKETLL